MRGMFALALWDGRTRTLIAARDRAGEKPLYYSLKTPQGLRLASEIKALLSRPEVDRTIDLEAIDQFLTYEYVIAPRTIFKSIRKLPAAHYLVYRDGEVSIRPALLGRRGRGGPRVEGRRGGGGAPRDAWQGRAQPDDVGRADRSLPVWRNRFQRRRDHASRRARRIRCVELQHGVRRWRATTNCRTPGKSRRCAARSITKAR